MPNITEAGDFTATVIHAEFGESKSGTPYLALSYGVNGSSITGWLYLSDKALTYSVKALREAFNFDGNFETAVAQVQGKSCRIVVEMEDYEGKVRPKVKFVNAPGGLTKSKPIPNAATFLNRLTAKAARLPAAPVTDDVPF